MGLKKSVMLADDTVTIMDKCTDKRNPDNAIAWSNLVNRGIVICNHLMKSSMPDLTNQEWQEILSVYAGTCGSLENPPFRIASDMMDNLGLIDIDKHPNKDLVKKVYEMSQAEQFAILSFNEQYWHGDWNTCSDFAEIKNKILV